MDEGGKQGGEIGTKGEKTGGMDSEKGVIDGGKTRDKIHIETDFHRGLDRLRERRTA